MTDAIPNIAQPIVPQVNAVRLTEVAERLAPLVASTQSKIPAYQNTTHRAATPTPYVTYGANGKPVPHGYQRAGEQLDEMV